MNYRVILPFTMNGERLSRGAIIPAGKIEEKANFGFLLKDKYIERMFDKVTGEDYVDGCYMVVRKFAGRGHNYKPGDFLDIRNDDWRNEKALIDSGYLIHATENDVARHTGEPSSLDSLSPHGAQGAPARAPIKLWKDEAWLKRSYLKEKKSIPQMEKEAGCARSTLWLALKNAGIVTRPRGRPKGS